MSTAAACAVKNTTTETKGTCGEIGMLVLSLPAQTA